MSSASSYEVQLSTAGDFGTLLYSGITTNRRVTPAVNLPHTELFWRVRAITPTGVRGAWGTTSFTRSSIAGPQLLTPADSQHLQQPEDAALLSWNPVSKAISYTIEVDDDELFIAPTTYTALNASFLLPDPGPAQTYHWHVRANFAGGFNSLWSDPRSFDVVGLRAPELTYPDDGATTQVQDAVLDWAPVPGAVRYEVRVSTDDQFNTIVDSATVVSTRYARPTTLNNDQYWWQVRAVDVNANKSPWTSSLFQFQRNWPEQPELVYPAQDELVGNPFYYQWAPIRHASLYRLELSEDSSFSAGVTDVCDSVSTTFTPLGGSDCMPVAGNLYYWRVRGVDAPGTVLGLYSQTGTFTYSPSMVSLSSPANGQTVEVPTLRWNDYAQAVKYNVIVKKASGAIAASNTTFANTWTPTGGARLNPADGPFRWTVQAVNQFGALTQVPTFASSRQFSLSTGVTDAGTDLTPTAPADGAHSKRFPELRWNPAFDASDVPATFYRVMIHKVGSTSVTSLADNFPYNSGTDDTITYLSPGQYEWWVEAHFFDGSTSTGPSRTFEIDNLDAVSGQRVSLSGQGFNNPTTTCSRQLDSQAPDAADICGNLQQMPVLRWDPVPDAGYYTVYLYNDRDMTNAVDPISMTTTANTVWTPPNFLPADNQAGTAYYWYVQACKTATRCAPDPRGTNNAATNAFDKRSNPVSGLQEREHESNVVLPPADPSDPTQPPTFADEVTLSWDPFIETNALGNDHDVTNMPSTLEALSYKVQISSDPTFTAGTFNYTSPLIDQTSFTPYTTLLPEGNLYWRVQAYDYSGHALAWSLTRNLSGETHAIEKRSPVPTLTSPGNGASVNGTPYFTWNALNYATRYDIQVYKNNDTTFSTANRVISSSSEQPTFTSPVILAASGSPYLWRVRRVDVNNNPGAWTAAKKFTVKGDPPTQLAPAAGSYVGAKDSLFTWSPVAGATIYRFERRLDGASFNQETITGLPGLAWAPMVTLSEGTQEWRVSAYDAGSNLLGTSPWRTYHVDSIAPTVVRKSPTGKVGRTVNFVAKFSEPVKHVGSSTMKLYVKGQRNSLAAHVTTSNGGKTATLNPKNNLRVGKTYTIKLTSGITDRAGLHLKTTTWKVTAK